MFTRIRVTHPLQKIRNAEDVHRARKTFEDAVMMWLQAARAPPTPCSVERTREITPSRPTWRKRKRLSEEEGSGSLRNHAGIELVKKPTPSEVREVLLNGTEGCWDNVVVVIEPDPNGTTSRILGSVRKVIELSDPWRTALERRGGGAGVICLVPIPFEGVVNAIWCTLVGMVPGATRSESCIALSPPDRLSFGLAPCLKGRTSQGWTDPFRPDGLEIRLGGVDPRLKTDGRCHGGESEPSPVASVIMDHPLAVAWRLDLLETAARLVGQLFPVISSIQASLPDHLSMWRSDGRPAVVGRRTASSERSHLECASCERLVVALEDMEWDRYFWDPELGDIEGRSYLWCKAMAISNGELRERMERYEPHLTVYQLSRYFPAERTLDRIVRRMGWLRDPEDSSLPPPVSQPRIRRRPLSPSVDRKEDARLMDYFSRHAGAMGWPDPEFVYEVPAEACVWGLTFCPWCGRDEASRSHQQGSASARSCDMSPPVCWDEEAVRDGEPPDPDTWPRDERKERWIGVLYPELPLAIAGIQGLEMHRFFSREVHRRAKLRKERLTRGRPRGSVDPFAVRVDRGELELRGFLADVGWNRFIGGGGDARDGDGGSLKLLDRAMYLIGTRWPVLERAWTSEMDTAIKLSQGAVAVGFGRSSAASTSSSSHRSSSDGRVPTVTSAFLLHSADAASTAPGSGTSPRTLLYACLEAVTGSRTDEELGLLDHAMHRFPPCMRDILVDGLGGTHPKYPQRTRLLGFLSSLRWIAHGIQDNDPDDQGKTEEFVVSLMERVWRECFVHDPKSVGEFESGYHKELANYWRSLTTKKTSGCSEASAAAVLSTSSSSVPSLPGMVSLAVPGGGGATGSGTRYTGQRCDALAEKGFCPLSTRRTPDDIRDYLRGHARTLAVEDIEDLVRSDIGTEIAPGMTDRGRLRSKVCACACKASAMERLGPGSDARRRVAGRRSFVWSPQDYYFQAGALLDIGGNI